jgi:hypothetical protein
VLCSQCTRTVLRGSILQWQAPLCGRHRLLLTARQRPRWTAVKQHQQDLYAANIWGEFYVLSFKGATSAVLVSNQAHRQRYYTGYFHSDAARRPATVERRETHERYERHVRYLCIWLWLLCGGCSRCIHVCEGHHCCTQQTDMSKARRDAADGANS